MSGWEWRADIDALAFTPSMNDAAGSARGAAPVAPAVSSTDNRTGQCFVHRRAFATLLGHDPRPPECAQYFEEHQAAFQSAAQRKIVRAAVKANENFHLTSRDIAREHPAHTHSNSADARTRLER